ncbi:MAG: hypothetical protein Q7V88_11690 [Actinomycetota bacterium]|nr:hypothetical protein [Actinomycetota bacterium]
MRRALLSILPAVAIVAAVVFAGGCMGSERDGSGNGASTNIETKKLEPGDEATYEYKVPFGTGNRLDSGAVLEIMPARLEVKVGESIRIINDDIRDYMIGPFFVSGGQSVAMQFTRPGVLSGACVINPEGEFEIIVTE